MSDEPFDPYRYDPTRSPYYDRHGNPIDLERWAQLREFGDPEFGVGPDAYLRVAEDTVGPYWISTVWLGIHVMPVGPPLTFETMVFPADGANHALSDDFDLVRYCTEEQAREGHAIVVEQVRALLEVTDFDLANDETTTEGRKND